MTWNLIQEEVRRTPDLAVEGLNEVPGPWRVFGMRFLRGISGKLFGELIRTGALRNLNLECL